MNQYIIKSKNYYYVIINYIFLNNDKLMPDAIWMYKR